jgi:hypothetical protein
MVTVAALQVGSAPLVVPLHLTDLTAHMAVVTHVMAVAMTGVMTTVVMAIRGVVSLVMVVVTTEVAEVAVVVVTIPLILAKTGGGLLTSTALMPISML